MGLIDDAIDQATDTADTVGDAADTAVGGTVDTVLDNDVVSVQEAVQGTVTGAYNLAPGGQNRSQDYVFDQLAGLTSSASENVGNAINDTPLDNPATDAAITLLNPVSILLNTTHTRSIHRDGTRADTDG